MAVITTEQRRSDSRLRERRVLPRMDVLAHYAGMAQVVREEREASDHASRPHSR